MAGVGVCHFKHFPKIQFLTELGKWYALQKHSTFSAIQTQQGHVLGGLTHLCKAAKRRDTARDLLESLRELMRSEGT